MVARLLVVGRGGVAVAGEARRDADQGGEGRRIGWLTAEEERVKKKREKK
jgi:hypothetical protein